MRAQGNEADEKKAHHFFQKKDFINDFSNLQLPPLPTVILKMTVREALN